MHTYGFGIPRLDGLLGFHSSYSFMYLIYELARSSLSSNRARTVGERPFSPIAKGSKTEDEHIIFLVVYPPWVSDVPSWQLKFLRAVDLSLYVNWNFAKGAATTSIGK